MKFSPNAGTFRDFRLDARWAGFYNRGMWPWQQAKKAWRERRWLAFAGLACLALIFLVGYALLEDRITDLINVEINKRDEAAIEWWLAFLSSDLFPVLAWLALVAVVLLATLLFLYPIGIRRSTKGRQAITASTTSPISKGPFLRVEGPPAGRSAIGTFRSPYGGGGLGPALNITVSGYTPIGSGMLTNSGIIQFSAIEKDKILEIEIILDPTGNMRLDRLELRLAGQNVPAHELPTELLERVQSYGVLFEVSAAIAHGEHVAYIWAMASGTEFESQRFTIDFNQP